MKFGKELEKELCTKDIPEEWIQVAIQYKALKKCINQVVNELQQLGLHQETLKLMIENGDKKSVVEVAHDDYLPSNPIVAEYNLNKTRSGGNGQIVLYLRLIVDFDSKKHTREQMKELGNQLRNKIEEMINKEGSIIESVQQSRIFELNDSNTLVLARDKEGTSLMENVIDKDELTHRNEIIIMLKSDTKFFRMLEDELSNLDTLKETEENKLRGEVEHICEPMQVISEPSNKTAKRRDFYCWRELFKIYLDSEVYFRNQNVSNAGSIRNQEQIEQRLKQFVERTNQTGVLERFTLKKSMWIFNQFVQLNYNLLKILHFQSINYTALLKILKKFDKQTCLGIKNKFSRIIGDEHVFVNVTSIAQSIYYLVLSSFLSLIPQLDDYSCPICMTIAFKPIALNCGHRFCVRCLVKMREEQKYDCPLCRRKNSILVADSSNLDTKSLVFMKRYFPLEIKEKMKDRDKERYQSYVNHDRCVVM